MALISVDIAKRWHLYHLQWLQTPVPSAYDTRATSGEECFGKAFLPQRRFSNLKRMLHLIESSGRSCTCSLEKKARSYHVSGASGDLWWRLSKTQLDTLLLLKQVRSTLLLVEPEK